MKTIIFCTAVLSLYWGNPDLRGYRNSSHEITRQLTAMLQYPQVLYNQEQNSIVVIQFHLGESSIIGRVKVFSENQDLNYDLIRQLTGKKLQLSSDDPYEKYTIKLRFKIEK
jgi:hypothetical protein